MKVYAVIERCSDDYYPDYRVLDNCVYLKKEDARKKSEEAVNDISYWSEDFEILEFEVKE